MDFLQGFWKLYGWKSYKLTKVAIFFFRVTELKVSENGR